MNKSLSETLIQQAEAAVDNGQSLETVLQTLEQWAEQHHNGAETLLPSLLTTNLLFAGIDLAAAVPGFSSTQRSRIQTPLMNASEQATALDWNRRKHPAVSGITLEKISVALARYVDFASVERAITNYNAANPEAPILVESRPDNAVLVEAIHQFQLKCYLETGQHDGLAGESVLDNLGLIDRSGMHSVDKPYSKAQSRLNSKARQVARESGRGITARSWFKHMVNPTFLGQRFTKGIHLVLIRKLRQVEQLFFNQSADTTPVELGRRFGVVANDPHRGMRFRGSGNHTFGLAFDLKYRGNPWVAGNPDRPNGNRYFDQAMERVARLMAGETSFSFTARYLHGLAQRLTTAAIHQELSRRDSQLRAYLRLADNRAQLQQTLEARRAAGTAGIFSSASESIEAATTRWTRQISTDLKALRSYFEPGRDPRNGFLNLPLELVIALRDRACMAWGAVDFGSNQSGDIMHFDLRITGVGKVLSRFSPRVHPCITSGSSDSEMADTMTIPPAAPYGETVLHQCRPGEGPPAAVPDPEGRGLHPLVYQGTSRRRSRNPSVGNAQLLLNRFLQQISTSLSFCTVRSAEVQRFIARGRAALQRNGQDPLVVDCRFGSSTEIATKMFQACKGLSRDGKIGPITWAELVQLRPATPVVPPVNPPITPPPIVSTLNPARWLPIVHGAISSAGALRTDNAVKFLIDGIDTFQAMVNAIRTAQNEEHYIYLLAWILEDNFEMIPGDPSSTFRNLLNAAASRGVQIRAMLWDQVGTQNSAEVRRINRLATGAAILDDETPNPIAAFGSHHQKVLIVKGSEGLITFCGGIDINDDRIRATGGSGSSGSGSSGGSSGSGGSGSSGSLGSGANLSGGSSGGGNPMHDDHCQIVGPSAHDLLQTFIRRWDHHPDHVRLDRTRGALLGRSEPVPAPIPSPGGLSSTGGPCAVAIARTFNPVTRGTTVPQERDIQNLLVAAIRNAERFIYIEDQYLIHPLAAAELRAAVPRLQHLTILITASELSDLPCVWKYRRDFISGLTSGLSASDRNKVRIFMLITPPPSTPPTFGRHTYVHAKSWVFDDELAVIGSANCNRRGWDHDSEVNAFIFENVQPVTTSQTFAQSYRAQLWAEHLNVPASRVADGVASAGLWLSLPAGAKVMRYNPTAGRDILPIPDAACDSVVDRIDPVP